MKFYKFNKFTATVLVLAIVAVGLSACTQPSPTSSVAPTVTVTAAPTPSPAENVIKWNYVVAVSRTQEPYWSIMGVELVDRIKKASNGRLILTAYGTDELVSNADMYNACKTGLAQMIRGTSVSDVGTMPASYFHYGWPGVVNSVEDIYLLWEQFGMKENAARMHAVNGIHYVDWLADDGLAIMFKKPITTLSDLKGLKIRAAGALGMILKGIGATITPVNVAEVYTSLSSGLIDAGGVGSIRGGELLKLNEVTKYYWQFMTVKHPGYYVVNADAWSKLPDDLKAIVDSAVRTVRWDVYLQTVAGEQRIIKDWQKDWGIQAIKISDAEQQKFAKTSFAVMAQIAAMDSWSAEAYEITKKFLQFSGRWQD